MQTIQVHATLFTYELHCSLKAQGALERGKPLHTYCNAKHRPEKMWPAAERHRVTTLGSTPSLYHTGVRESAAMTSLDPRFVSHDRWSHPSGLFCCIPRDYTQESQFDIIWASPDCREYSIAHCRSPRDLESANKLTVRRTLDPIQYNTYNTSWGTETPPGTSH